MIDILSSSSEIDFPRIPQDRTDDLPLIHVVASDSLCMLYGHFVYVSMVE